MTTRQIFIGATVGLAVALCVVGGVKLYRMWYDRKAPNFKGAKEVYVYPYMSAQEVCDTLLASGLVRKPASLLRVFKDVERVQTGHYCVDGNCSSMYVARMFRGGWQTPVNLTLSGSIRTPGILARKVGAQMLADSSEVADFAFSDDSLARYGVDAAHVFTIVIPDTYQILWTASVSEIFDRLAKESAAWWTAERKEAARKQGLTPAQAVTLASIVAGETRYEPEMPTIAGVYLNRLRTGMRLQADPTIAFCFDYEPKRILNAHLSVESPYNTYKYAGLPPGPIACPPKSCLEAVLHPQSHNYIFFCADPSFNGSHRFAANYTEHLANARAFQKALTERQKAAK